MKWILIGHRGVGKTKLLERLKVYLKNSNLNFIDLDAKIENQEKKSLSELFLEIGESKFRELEEQTFLQIHKKYSSYILSVGAGFTLDKTDIDSKDLRIIWLRRETDQLGRIFFNRPRLNLNISPLEEFKERFPARQKKYLEMANDIYFMPEGIERIHPIEEKIFTQDNFFAKGILTLTSWHFKSKEMLFLRYGCDFYELRDDLLQLNDCNWQSIPKEQRLLSFRDQNNVKETFKFLSEVAESDWALELGSCPEKEISLISSHDFLTNESLAQFLLRLEKGALPHQHLKAAPKIKSYSELKELLKWQANDPKKRSILPRSSNKELDRWLWVRLYLKGRQKINFWRDGEGSAPGQPTLFQWLSTNANFMHFAALLGNPVTYSKTMIEQSSYFADLNWPIWPIPLDEEEFKDAVDFLISKGLMAAAVTAPLKKQAGLTTQIKTSQAKALQTVNTLGVSETKIHGHNTDLDGLQKLLQTASVILQIPLAQMKVVIWGGGGTLSALQEVLPQAVQLSVRSRMPRQLKDKIPSSTHLLVWAAGPEDDFPPDFEFELVVDLNYREDSKAREWALIKNKKYLSGDIMFETQAQGQRDFWTNLKMR